MDADGEMVEAPDEADNAMPTAESAAVEPVDNAVALASAVMCVEECAAVMNCEATVVELLRFTYYYGMKRQEREKNAKEWLAEHRPDYSEADLVPLFKGACTCR